MGCPPGWRSRPGKRSLGAGMSPAKPRDPWRVLGRPEGARGQPQAPQEGGGQCARCTRGRELECAERAGRRLASPLGLRSATAAQSRAEPSRAAVPCRLLSGCPCSLRLAVERRRAIRGGQGRGREEREGPAGRGGRVCGDTDTGGGRWGAVRECCPGMGKGGTWRRIRRNVGKLEFGGVGWERKRGRGLREEGRETEAGRKTDTDRKADKSGR